MKNLIKMISFIVICIVLFFMISSLINPSGSLNEWYSSNAIKDFYKQKNDIIDVIYLGNSCVYTGISPLETYQNTGITGYSLSSSGQKIWSSYYLLKEALKTQKPKVVYLEIGELFSTPEKDEELNKRYVIDSMKFSQNKIDMINDDVYMFNDFDKLGCIFPLIRFHTRWQNINQNDLRKYLKKGEVTYKGYLLNKKITKYDGTKEKNNKKNEKINEEDKEYVVSEASNKYIDKIAEICNENSIELEFFKMPEPKFWNEEKNAITKEYLENKQMSYLDLTDESVVKIDWTTDTQDGGNHLNLDGAEKIAKIMSDRLTQKYKLEDHRKDSKYESWNKLLKKYIEDKNKKE